MTWVYGAAFVASCALVGLGWAAFWPEFPPVDDTPLPEEPKRPRRYRGRQRPDERLDGAEIPLPPARKDLTGENPIVVLNETADGDSARWTTTGAGETQIPVPVRRPDPRPLDRRPQHRFEHVGEGTQPIRWPLMPEDEDGPPEWPPWQPK